MPIIEPDTYMLEHLSIEDLEGLMKGILFREIRPRINLCYLCDHYECENCPARSVIKSKPGLCTQYNHLLSLKVSVPAIRQWLSSLKIEVYEMIRRKKLNDRLRHY